MSKGNKNHKYSGILAKPLTPMGMFGSSVPGLPLPSEQLAIRLSALLAEFKIELSKDWEFRLALALAQRHVPGFRMANGSNTLPKGLIFGLLAPPIADLALRSAVDTLRSEKNLSVADACRVLAKRKHDQFTAPRGKSVESHAGTLRRRYHGRRKAVRTP